jgi:hypothetical protein
MPDIKIGKFDILATYTYAQALLHDVPDAEARQRGIVAAIMGAKAKSGASAGSAFVFGFWLASPRATRGQGHHPEFAGSREGQEQIPVVSPLTTLPSGLPMSTRATRRLAGSEMVARTVPIGFVAVVLLGVTSFS